MGTKLKKVISKRGLSRFINRCVKEHFDAMEREGKFRELEKAYRRAAGKAGRGGEFEAIDHEDWPEW